MLKTLRPLVTRRRLPPEAPATISLRLHVALSGFSTTLDLISLLSEMRTTQGFLGTSQGVILTGVRPAVQHWVSAASCSSPWLLLLAQVLFFQLLPVSLHHCHPTPSALFAGSPFSKQASAEEGPPHQHPPSAPTAPSPGLPSCDPSPGVAALTSRAGVYLLLLT